MESETIERALVEKVFEAFDPALAVTDCLYIETGKYNRTFKVQTTAAPYILRVAPPEESEFLFYERNNMLAEPEIHQLVLAETDLKIPEIYKLDDSKSILPNNYLIMEYFDASPGYSRRQAFRLGQMMKQLHQVGREAFGYTWRNQAMEPQDNWRDAFRIMWKKLIDDIARVGHLTEAEYSQTRSLLDQYLDPHFNHEPSSTLLHMDVWYQNILVDHRSGEVYLIDWDRALCGDVEIEFAVWDYCGIPNSLFWEGYGWMPPEMDRSFQIRRIFYLLYEQMKYIVIEQGRGNNRNQALAYKQKAAELMSVLR